MKIDGRRIAEGILASLKKDVNLLKEKDVTPTLAIILVGDDPASVSFIRQKRIAAEKIGANLTSDQLPISTTTKVLKERMENYNKDPDIHGIIIQRPLPKDSPIDRNILLTVSPQKDVDGFVPNSSFHAPVADAVFTLLEKIHTTAKDKNIVIIGRGETAGTPIARLSFQKGFHPAIIHSKTPNPEHILKEADIIISCVGKQAIVRKEFLKPGVILIGVGMHREEDGTLHGDYEENEIAPVASYFTPTPGGVGPVNVACLMKNLLRACIIEKGGTT